MMETSPLKREQMGETYLSIHDLFGSVPIEQEEEPDDLPAGTSFAIQPIEEDTDL